MLDEDVYDIDSAWSSYVEGDFKNSLKTLTLDNECEKKNDSIPKCTDLYISTKTKIGYLSESINLYDVFWKIEILPYHLHKNGIIKKQMKFNSMDKESHDAIQKNIFGLKNLDQHIIQQIINPDGRIKFKDIRKITIGLSNKDITSYRSKKKSAFYNCFVIIIRIKMDDTFKEVHVKVFNTGKLEIPGIRCDRLLVKVTDILVETLKSIINTTTLYYDSGRCETVLINSNFNCGYYINRDKLLDILKYKYNIDSIFDACQYPGIQCKYNYKENNNIKYTVSFMIFRTGSVLIVGKCDEFALNHIYEFIKNLLIEEYPNIYVKHNNNILIEKNKKKIKKKKKTLN